MSDPFETLLKLALSEGDFASQLQAEVDATFDGRYATRISPIKEAAILNRLQQSVTAETVGQLIQSVIHQQQIDLQPLLIEIAMPEDTFRSLWEDRILVDSVPIKLIQQLMNRLMIPFDRLQKAVWLTFDQISTSSTGVELIPTRYYRKSAPGMDTEREQLSTRISCSNDQNQRTMLNQYMDRLEQIY